MEKTLKTLFETIDPTPLLDLIWEYSSELADEHAEMREVTINGTKYVVYKSFSMDGNTYVMLINEVNWKNMIFRKRIVEEGKEHLIGLDDDDEEELAFLYFQKILLTEIREKHKKRKSELPEDFTTD